MKISVINYFFKKKEVYIIYFGNYLQREVICEVSVKKMSYLSYLEYLLILSTVPKQGYS